MEPVNQVKTSPCEIGMVWAGHPWYSPREAALPADPADLPTCVGG